MIAYICKKLRFLYIIRYYLFIFIMGVLGIIWMAMVTKHEDPRLEDRISAITSVDSLKSQLDTLEIFIGTNRQLIDSAMNLSYGNRLRLDKAIFLSSRNGKKLDSIIEERYR